MEILVCLLFTRILLLLVPSVLCEQCRDQLEDCGIINRQRQQITTGIPDLSTDFENGYPNVWIDESQSVVRWKIEDYNSPWELNNRPFKPSVGSKYLRVNRGSTLSFGVTIYRSPTFNVTWADNFNDISLSFDFWVRSKWSQFTNLELYLNENGNEKQLLNLLTYSVITQQNWTTTSIYPLQNISPPSEISLAFYAYCGTNAEDAVVIDNIRWMHFSSSSTTPTPTSPETEPPASPETEPTTSPETEPPTSPKTEPSTSTETEPSTSTQWGTTATTESETTTESTTQSQEPSTTPEQFTGTDSSNTT